MKTVLKSFVFALLILLAFASTSEAGWLIYHESELKGQIIDIDTKQPIEGAVVVVAYQTATSGLGAGQGSSNIAVGEALTDKEGNFSIPSYTSIIQPFSWQIPSEVLVFKPGYASLESGLSYLVTGYFKGEQTKEQEGSWHWSKELKYRLPGLGIVELPKHKTREERRLHMPSPITGISYKRQKLLMQVLNEECSNLNLDKYKVE